MKKTSTINFRELYDAFDAPVTPIDCGLMCAPHNPRGIPFCCDICCAVPVAYKAEWQYLRGSTSLWHGWRGDECPDEKSDRAELVQQTPSHLCLLACRGPQSCERPYRAVSCRQFPFFPYITSDFCFIGLTYDWEFTSKCWVISNLHLVTAAYRNEFIQTFDKLFETWLEDMDCYVELSAETREHYQAARRRIPLLHRDGRTCMVSPVNERVYRVSLNGLPRFDPFIDPPQ
jgi:hypothetical protein